MRAPDPRADRGFRPRRGPGAALLVLALHLLLGAGLWRAMAQREVEVRPAPPALTWVRPLAPLPRPAPPPLTGTPRPARPHSPERRAPSPAPAEPAAITLVSPPAVAAAEPASAPASAPPERLLDTAATRDALRAMGRQPLLSERAAAATDSPIARTDTALARGTAEAAKPDCMRDGVPGGLLGLPLLAGRALSGNCAK